MKVMRLQRDGGTLSLKPAEVKTPVPNGEEILVEVCAAGVTPSELLWYPTEHRADGTVRTGAVPGHEFSGTVAAVGSQVDGFAIGQPVFGLNDWFSDGATAEFCLTRAAMIAPKPRQIGHAAAATVPIAALTAMQGLDRLGLRPGERLLVPGASGAVGSWVVQMATARGVHVIATTSGETLEFVRELGAAEVLDYRADPFGRIAQKVDGVFDCVGGETLRRCWEVLATGGRVVTIAAASEAQTEQRIKDAFFIVEPNAAQLAEAARQLDAGTVKTFVRGTVPLAEANVAYFGVVPEALPYGKSVIAVAVD